MTNYAVCPCVICDKPMSFDALREGVYWAPKATFETWWRGFWTSGAPADEMFFAHRACWKRLPEKRRRLIRLTSDPRFEPKTLEQYA
jgi:hypothetical protein